MVVIKNKIERIMNKETGAQETLCSFGLLALSKSYGGVMRLRNYLHEAAVIKNKKLSCKTISVGNLCVGGTGKTPMTIYIARLLQARGFTVCVISRGYKGRREKKGGLVSDGQQIFMSTETAGDEPFMMARTLRGIPVFVGKDRFGSGLKAIDQFNPDVIVLDDAFQHRNLFRDIDLVLLDGKSPFGNGKLLPRGRLREPVTALERSHAVIFTRLDKKEQVNPADLAAVKKGLNDRPVFYAGHQPFVVQSIDAEKNLKKQSFPEKPISFNHLAGKRVIAFSGIADNENFKQTLNGLSLKIQKFFGFPDHHTYSAKDLQTIIQDAAAEPIDYLVTTEKDFVKLPRDLSWPVTLLVMGIRITMTRDEKDFERFLISCVS